MESINPELALCGSKKLCARIDTVFFLISEVCEGTVSLLRKTPPDLDSSWIFNLIIHHTFTYTFSLNQPVQSIGQNVCVFVCQSVISQKM